MNGVGNEIPPLLFDLWDGKNPNMEHYILASLPSKKLYYRKGRINRKKAFDRANPWRVRVWNESPQLTPELAASMALMGDGVVELVAYVGMETQIYPMTMVRSRFLKEYRATTNDDLSELLG